MVKFIKTAGVILMSFFLTFGATPTKATDSISGYITRYTVNTADSAGWSSGERTTVSDTSVERNGKRVVSFYADRDAEAMSATFTLGEMPSTEFDVTSLTFKFLLYIDDINAVKDRSGNLLGGKIGFYGKKIYTTETEAADGEGSSEVFAEEPVYFTWDLSTVSLKKGWNRLTLNFKTAETDRVVNGYTFEGITEFRLTLNKSTTSDLTVALDNAEICVLSIAEDGEIVKPITDTYSVKEIAVAAGIAAAVVGGLTAAGYIWAKKEEKRRLRERRARARARRQREKKENEDA